MKLDSSVSAIITGGASGLGRAAACALANRGVRVAIFDMNVARGTELAAAISGVFCQVDVTDQAAVDAGFAKARSVHGQERIMVNCAGGGIAARTVRRKRDTGVYEAHELTAFAKVLTLNVIGTFQCTAKSAAGMAGLAPFDGERGVVVNTASVAAEDGQIGQAAYAAAKAAIVGMTLPIARDLSSEGIRINAIMPGVFATPPMMALPEAMREGLSASVPFPKRLGDPDEFGSMVLEVVRNTYLNGAAIRLDGAIRMPPR